MIVRNLRKKSKVGRGKVGRERVSLAGKGG